MTNSALFFLLTRSARNSLVHKLSRLKSPRYLLPFLAGLAYIWFMLANPLIGNRDVAPDTEDIGRAVQAYSGVGVLFFAAMSWLLAPNNPTLYMNEAEVTQLCTAPLTRQQIIVYRWLRAQLPLLFMAMIAGLFALRRSAINPLFAAAGAWLLVNLLMLNGMAAALFSGKLKSWGVGGLGMRVPGMLLVALLALVFGLNYTPAPSTREAELFLPWLEDLLNGGVAGYVLWPLRQVTGMAAAPDLATFARGAGIALGLMVVLYQFATRLNTPFEEDALALAQNVGRRLEAFRRGGASGTVLAKLKTAKPSRLKLAESGPAWRALVWKSIIGQTRGISLRLLIPFAGLALALAIAISYSGERRMMDLMVVTVFSVFVVMLLIAGPQMLRNDLRAELQRLDYIKSLPVRGRDVLRGEVYGSASLISVALVLLVFAGAFLFQGGGAITYNMRVILVLSAAFALPPVAALGFALENGGAVLMPAWATVAPGSGGVELIGRNMLMTLLRLIAMSVLLTVPGAAIAAGVALGLSWFNAGTSGALWLIPAAALVGGLTIVGEIELMLAFFGRRLERLDPSSERF